MNNRPCKNIPVRREVDGKPMGTIYRVYLPTTRKINGSKGQQELSTDEKMYINT